MIGHYSCYYAIADGRSGSDLMVVMCVFNFMTGLYDRFRGPHMYWLTAIADMQRGGGAESRSLNLEVDGLVNLVHYEDAAEAAVKALLRGVCCRKHHSSFMEYATSLLC
jgi:hypothetical protein